LSLLVAVSVATPALAHKQHKQERAQQAAAVQRQAAASDSMSPARMHAQMGEMMTEDSEPLQKSFAQRLLDWAGRLHPMIVHFPIAFFPAALFTAVVGRRRSGFATPVQFLVVAGGILAPISALLGWFNGGLSLSDADPLMMVHRWLGTGIGAGGLLLGIWAWRRPSQDRSTGMIAGLAAMTVAIVVQGWFGGALVHGIDHLNW
jgi:uncharacterized membrane protein